MNKVDLNTIIDLVEIKFGRGSSVLWKNRDFEDLNFEITKKTKTNISAHTLKRIFGKIKTDDYYLPQRATIIALQQYVDFKSSDKKKPEFTKIEPENESKIIDQEKEKSPKTRKILILSFVIMAILALTYLSFDTNKVKSTTLGEIKLISTEGRIPKSAEFEYSTPNNKDSFKICFDGNFDQMPVPNGKKMKATYYYQYPGYFRVRMWSKDSIISETIPVYVPTNGWEAYGMYHKQLQLNRFYHINLQKAIQNNSFSPTKQVISNAGMDTSKLTVISLNNYYPTGINGDNFKLETTLKNSDEWPSASCNSVYLDIEGTNESIQLHFTNPGCSYWIHCRLSEKKFDKRNHNFKNLTFNLTKWQKFHIENKNKNVRVFVNDTLRFSSSYSKSIGEIMGVTVRFQGNGYLKNYLLSDLEGNDLFKFPEEESQVK